VTYVTARREVFASSPRYAQLGHLSIEQDDGVVYKGFPQREPHRELDVLPLCFVKTKRSELSMQEALCLDGSSLHGAVFGHCESVLETSGRGSTAEMQAVIAL
jgi:hypothetical protein